MHFSKSLRSCTTTLLRRKKYVYVNAYWKERSIINKTQPVSFNGYGSIVDNAAAFGAYHSCRIFIDDAVIVRSHYDGCSEITGDMKQQLHDFVRCFGVEVTRRLIGQY